MGDVKKRITDLRREAKAHAAMAAGFIVDGQYSGAATECHRAHQKELIADALQVYFDG